MVKKSWTRNQKLLLAGILVTLFAGLIGLVGKISIEINYLKNEIDTLKAKNATIGILESEIAEIKKLFADTIESRNFNTGKCLEGYFSAISQIGGGISIGCIPDPKK